MAGKDDVAACVERELDAVERAYNGVWKLDETKKRNFLLALRFLQIVAERRGGTIDTVTFVPEGRSGKIAAKFPEFLLTGDEHRAFAEIADLIDVVSFFPDVRMRTAVEVVVTGLWVREQSGEILSGGKA